MEIKKQIIVCFVVLFICVGFLSYWVRLLTNDLRLLRDINVVEWCTLHAGGWSIDAQFGKDLGFDKNIIDKFDCEKFISDQSQK